MVEIICPHYSEYYDGYEGDLEAIVTYWGDGPVIELECPHCEKTFYVREFVTRFYDTGKTKEEL